MRRLFQRWIEARRRRRALNACLDALFSQPETLKQARLRPDHRHRVVVLENELAADGTPVFLRLGIVRHPKAHPLQPRGEEVLEILDYRPGERTIEVAGSRNLTRRGLD